jgi:RNA polymerase sigma factor (sigma-70 family)
VRPFALSKGDARTIMAADLERAALTKALGQVAARDAAALREVYRRTSAKLLGVILRILNDRDEAEDVLQEVYIAVWNKADRFDADRASPITWLVSIARNRSIDRLRARKPTTDLDAAAQVADPQPSALSLLEAQGDRARLDECLQQLDERHASAVRTAFFQGVTYEALAQTVGVPLGTMKTWIRRSLLSLRACLQS